MSTPVNKMLHLSTSWLDLLPGGRWVEGGVCLVGGIATMNSDSTKSVTHREVRLVLATMGLMIMVVGPMILAGVAITKLDMVQESSAKTADKVSMMEGQMQQINLLKQVLDNQGEELRRLRDKVEGVSKK